jgi:hypothetical protein
VLGEFGDIPERLGEAVRVRSPGDERRIGCKRGLAGVPTVRGPRGFTRLQGAVAFSGELAQTRQQGSLDPRGRLNVKPALIWIQVISRSGKGGDGSITAPVVRAWANASGKKLGMILFDSRVDSRDLSVGGPSASTPLRALLESNFGIRGLNVFHVGAHGFLSSVDEQRWAENRGVTVVTAREVRAQGIGAVTKRALAVASDGTDAIYVSVDGTVLDVEWSGATLSAAPGGFRQ